MIDIDEINDKGGTLLRDNLKEISVIDLAFNVRFRQLHWENWRYLPPTGSDHEIIASDIIRPHLSQPSETPALNLPPSFNHKKADWDKFKKAVQKEVKNINVPENPMPDTMDTLAQSFAAAVNVAAEAAIPRSRPCERSKPWWTEELKALRKTLHSTLRAFKRARDETQLIAWKNARNTYFHAIRDAKTKHWEEFKAGATGKEVFKAAKYTRPALQRKIPNISTGSEEARTFKEKCQVFMSTLFPPPLLEPPFEPPQTSQPQQAPAATQPSKLTSPVNGPRNPQPRLIPKNPQSPQRPTSSTSKGNREKVWPWPELSPKEVKHAIFSSSATKAPGPDKIGFAIIQHAYNAAPNVFYRVYTVLFSHGYHPKCWRKCNGLVLPKPKKKDYTNPKSYRVIALLNCLGKVLEKILAVRLSYLANIGGLLHDTQLGSRKQRSAIDAALLLMHYIQQQKAKRKRSVTSVLFLDIKGAFDHVSKPKLLAAMQGLQLPQSLISWVDSFLSERVARLMFARKIQDETPVQIGIPQGSPISPILFLIYTKDI